MTKYRIVEHRWGSFIPFFHVQSRGFLWLWHDVEKVPDDAIGAVFARAIRFGSLETARQWVAEQRIRETPTEAVPFIKTIIIHEP